MRPYRNLDADLVGTQGDDAAPRAVAEEWWLEVPHDDDGAAKLEVQLVVGQGACPDRVEKFQGIVGGLFFVGDGRLRKVGFALPLPTIEEK